MLVQSENVMKKIIMLQGNLKKLNIKQFQETTIQTEECRLLGCGAAQIFCKPTFWRDVIFLHILLSLPNFTFLLITSSSFHGTYKGNGKIVRS
jgi:hypothetical protein